MRLMAERAPDVVALMLERASKWNVIELLASSSRADTSGLFQPLQLIKVVGGVTTAMPIQGLSPLPHQPGRFVAADLSLDPKIYLELDNLGLEAFVTADWRRFPVIKANAQPILVPIRSDEDGRTCIDFAALQERMAILQEALPSFVPRLLSALKAVMPQYPPPAAVEQQLYSGGFASRADAALASQVAQMEPASMAEHALAISDPRLREHALRWAYAANPDVLRPGDRRRIDDLVRERLLGNADKPWRTIAEARNEVIALRIEAAAQDNLAAMAHCDRIAMELFFIEERHRLKERQRTAVGEAE